MARVWKDEEIRLNVKIRKKEYRKCQRRSVFIFEEKKNKNIEKLFTSTNKEDFWKSIKSYKEGSNLTIKNEDEKKELINELKSLFSINKDLIEEDLEKKEIDELVNKHEKECEKKFKEIDKVYANKHMISRVIKELKYSNTRGNDGMNNNMVKMVLDNDTVIEKIKSFMKMILNTGYVP